MGGTYLGAGHNPPIGLKPALQIGKSSCRSGCITGYHLLINSVFPCLLILIHLSCVLDQRMDISEASLVLNIFGMFRGKFWRRGLFSPEVVFNQEKTKNIVRNPGLFQSTYRCGVLHSYVGLQASWIWKIAPGSARTLFQGSFTRDGFFSVEKGRVPLLLKDSLCNKQTLGEE